MKVLSSLVLIALISAVFAGCGPSCPDGYLNWEHDCYKLYDVQKTWANAEQHCVADGAHLASIHSAAEDNFLNLLSQQGTAGSKHTWMGLNDHATEGSFVWTDGSPCDYFNWHNAEPNNAGAGEQCGEINFFALDGTWNDHFCSRTHRFICKIPPSYH
ncbi:echinoidin-like [Patiria miniata]|uniref:C-type lectin domain-containing protein n=1 Tax=Patiria miniata TaxID=46514 RepID=A0A914BF42_PATMI|nr:echinoidin-like [Patiria miniata]